MATGPAISIRLKGVAFAGAGGPVIGPVSLDIAGGEVVALMGASGVGKTTLLRLIAGLERRFEGEVLVGACAPAMGPAPGFAFQDARLLPWLDSAENLRAVRPDMTDREVDTALDMVGLAGQARAYAHQMSGGMQRRLGLARALAVGAPLWLLDEPFASLDDALVRDLQGMLGGKLAAERPTVVIVSHAPKDVAPLATRAILLSGRPARVAGDLALDPSQPEVSKERLLRALASGGQDGG
jgi:ABC-type nitrate/sulfonate/bicarbonate transport system ATPase subunit